MGVSGGESLIHTLLTLHIPKLRYREIIHLISIDIQFEMDHDFYWRFIEPDIFAHEENLAALVHAGWCPPSSAPVMRPVPNSH